MSSSAESGPRKPHRRRRSEPKGWKAIPKAAKVLIGMCLLVLILVPVALQNGWIGRRKVDTSAALSSGPSGLLIAEAALDPATRTIKGVVQNTSKNGFRNVQVSYYIRDTQGLEAGTIMGLIDSIGPNETARFQTDPLPPNGREFLLREVVGTPR